MKRSHASIALALPLLFGGGVAGTAHAQHTTAAERMGSTALARSALHATSMFAVQNASVAALVASTAPRDRNLPFLHGNKTPQELALKMRVALKQDPNGNAIIDPARCRQDGSCASVRNYWDSFRMKKPDLRLEDVPDYVYNFKKLQPSAEDYQTEWDTDCLHAAPNGSYQTIIGCLHRKPKPGEMFWVDDLSNPLNFMFEDCSNPRHGKHQEPAEVVVTVHCREIRFMTPPGTVAVMYEVVGNHQLDVLPICPTMIKKAGTTVKVPPGGDCPVPKECLFTEPRAYASIRTGITITHTSVKGAYGPVPEGENVFYFSPDIENGQIVIICIKVQRPDGTVVIYRSKNVAGAVYDSEGKVTLPPFVPS